MNTERHDLYFGYKYSKRITYAKGAQEEEKRQVKNHSRFDSKLGTGPIDCGCALDENGQKCTEKTQVQPDGSIKKIITCLNRKYNYECRPEVCGETCQNQELQKFNANYEVGPVTVDHTGMYGLGLFASDDIPPDTVIGEYIGEMRCQAKGKRNVLSSYVFGVGTGFFGRKDLLIDAIETGNHMRLVNHSCNANCSTQQVVIGASFHIKIKSNKMIKKDAEITISYGDNFFLHANVSCRCGAENCIEKRRPTKDK